MAYKLLRHSTTDQRVWEDDEGRIFLSDHSADTAQHIGRPDETDDGPWQVMIPAGYLAMGLKKGASPRGWRIPVSRFGTALGRSQLSEIMVGWDLALFLADRLKLALKIQIDDRMFELREVSKPVNQMALIS